MPSEPFSARLHDPGTTFRTTRLAWRGPRPGRTALVAVLVVAGLLAVVYLVLRLTPLSAVQNVTVVGVQGPKASEIRHAIERAATGQSTLGFQEGAIRDAVADTRSVTGVEVHTRFPHGVQIEVHQLLAVGVIETGGRRVAVSADGRVLPDWTPGTLPVIRGGEQRGGALVGGAKVAARILGGAPQALLARVARVDGGYTVRLAGGPALLFRDGNRLAAKWAAAVAVLTDPGTRGATWIDLRVPEQPVSGSGAPPTLPARDAKVGKVPTATDALATAEGLTPAPDAAASTPDATAGGPAAGTAATTRSATPAATAGASTTGVGTASTAPTATAGTTTPGAAGAGTTTATGTGGATSGGAGTASTRTASTPDSAPETSASGAAGGATAGTQNGGGTAPGAQTAP
jgi:cell division septal protein FtsQ